MSPDLDKLATLANFLDTVPDNKHFDMTAWQRGRKIGPFSWGYAACALGWAAEKKVFPGLELHFQYIKPFVRYQGYDGYYAAAILFGITIGDAENFFGPHAYEHARDFNTGRITCEARPKDVADRIRAFIRNEKSKAAVEQIKLDATTFVSVEAEVLEETN